MSNTTTRITCTVSATGPGLEFVARVNEQVFFQGDPNGKHDLAIELPDADATHSLIFELRGKTAAHTKLDQDGRIIDDILVQVIDLAFDEIKLGSVFIEHAVYNHDFNGTKNAVQEKFYGTMGCNGTVTLEFSAPLYLWLLEHM